MLRAILQGLRGDRRGQYGSSKTRSNQRARVQVRCVLEDLEGRQLLSGLAGHQIHEAAAVHIAKVHHPAHHQAQGHNKLHNSVAGESNVGTTPANNGSTSSPGSTAGIQITPPNNTNTNTPPPSSLTWHYMGVAQLYTPAITYAGYSNAQVATILQQSGLSASEVQGLINGQQVTILDTTDNAQAQNFMSSYIIPSVVQVHYYIQTS